MLVLSRVGLLQHGDQRHQLKVGQIFYSDPVGQLQHVLFGPIAINSHTEGGHRPADPSSSHPRASASSNAACVAACARSMR
ncbi:hypothetical protein AWC00_25960 [Mycobacterium conspicuum]|nr:hypothetical protein AWC00_25960 [Mycobacterium conspicuum]